MSAENNNLLLKLHNLAHRQEENFISDAFVHTASYLLENEPKCGVEIVRLLTNSFVDHKAQQADQIQITTQVTNKYGRPDIVIKTLTHLVYVEVKAESGLGHKQLTRYKNDLLQSGFSNTLLVLLTRYPVENINDNSSDFSIRWYQVVDWLEQSVCSDKVSRYVVNQFVNFAKGRGIAMDKVEWQLIEGSKSLINMLSMINEALAALKIKIYQRRGTVDWNGFYLDSGKCFIGFYYSEPNFLQFEAYYKQEINPDEIKLGEANGEQWINKLDLLSEDLYFFSRSKVSQLKCIEQFIKESWNYKNKIKFNK